MIEKKDVKKYRRNCVLGIIFSMISLVFGITWLILFFSSPSWSSAISFLFGTLWGMFTIIAIMVGEILK